MDYLKLARQRVADIGDLEIEEVYLSFAPVIAAEAIAAALIALAEPAKPRFVQLDGRRFNANSITQVEDFGAGITVYFVSGPAAQFRGPAKAAFLLWQEHEANVVRLEIPADGAE